MRTFVKTGVLSLALLGLVAAGGCATVGSVGPAAQKDPARMTYLDHVSNQLDQMQSRIQAIQARLAELGGQTRTHLADRLATVRLDLFDAQRDLRALRGAHDASQWKQDRGQLETELHQMDHTVSHLDRAVNKA